MGAKENQRRCCLSGFLLYLCTAISHGAQPKPPSECVVVALNELSRGVMVTRQILALKLRIRILPGQLGLIAKEGGGVHALLCGVALLSILMSHLSFRGLDAFFISLG